MITLPHHVEFLSDAWLSEANRFLERECARRQAALGAAPFSLAERFTNAPPHLKCPGGVAQWSMNYDGARVTVSRVFDSEASVVAEGDYQAALTAAQYVGISEPGGDDRVWREIEQMFSKDVLRVRGDYPSDPATDMIAHLHDHMGRITVENPDLCHRAERQGLAGKIREMEEQGYTVIENAISADFADEVRAATLQTLSSHQVNVLQWMLYHGRAFELLVQNPLLMTLIDASLGRGAVIASLSAIRRGPGPGFIPMHTDYAHVPEPYPNFAMTGVGVWALEDWTEASGPTWMVPGSHRLRRGPKPGEAHQGDAMPITMPKGSVVFFTNGIWHWQGDRSEAGERVTLHMHFNRGIMRSLEPKKIDSQMLHRNAPRLGEMLGQDDWFDKMDGIGRDYQRFDYMRRLHAFTDEKKAAILADAA